MSWGDTPPLMGLPSEKIHDGVVDGTAAVCDFYTCLLLPYRVYVWGGYGEWLIQVENVDTLNPVRARMPLYRRFQSCSTDHHKMPSGDPLALKAVLYELTACREEGDEAA